MKNRTDFRSSVETGMDPRLVFKALLPGRMWGDRLGKTEKYLQIIDLRKIHFISVLSCLENLFHTKTNRDFQWFFKVPVCQHYLFGYSSLGCFAIDLSWHK